MARPKNETLDFGNLDVVAANFRGSLKGNIGPIATVGTPDATDLPTAITLVNALKARLNQLITALN